MQMLVAESYHTVVLYAPDPLHVWVRPYAIITPVGWQSPSFPLMVVLHIFAHFPPINYHVFLSTVTAVTS